MVYLAVIIGAAVGVSGDIILVYLPNRQGSITSELHLAQTVCLGGLELSSRAEEVAQFNSGTLYVITHEGVQDHLVSVTQLIGFEPIADFSEPIIPGRQSQFMTLRCSQSSNPPSVAPAPNSRSLLARTPNTGPLSMSRPRTSIVRN